jgi:methylglutaconyl-CoA hydratase
VSDLTVTTRIDGRVARVTLDAPRQRNALTYDTLRQLIAALGAADADDDVRAVLLSGSGGNFSAGANLKEFQAELEQPLAYHWRSADLWSELFTLVPSMDKPVVAAVAGNALAGGCGLAAAADVVIAADDAKFGLTEIRIGLFPLIVLPAMRRAIGDRQTRRLALTGEIIDAQEALRLGLVARVVPAADLDAAASAVAHELASRSAEALRLGKHILEETAEMTYDQALAFGRNVRALFLKSDGLKEGIAAFLEKRPPRW